MSADGELYVGDDWQEFCRDELDKMFGKGKWSIDVSQYINSWDLSALPDKMNINILDKETDEKIGVLHAINKFVIESEMENRYVRPEPDKFIIRRVK